MEIFSAWRKERLVYTAKLIIFAAPTGVEVIDLIPIAELAAIRNDQETAAKLQRRGSVLDDDEDDDGGMESRTSKALELAFETQPSGYNSGRTYRVCFLNDNRS